VTEHRRAWSPIKHGWVRRIADWPRSSFRAFTERGVCPEDWGGENVQVSRQGSNASDAVPFGHRILHGLIPFDILIGVTVGAYTRHWAGEAALFATGLRDCVT
jgi:hypothetical protein